MTIQIVFMKQKSQWCIFRREKKSSRRGRSIRWSRSGFPKNCIFIFNFRRNIWRFRWTIFGYKTESGIQILGFVKKFQIGRTKLLASGRQNFVNIISNRSSIFQIIKKINIKSNYLRKG